MFKNAQPLTSDRDLLSRSFERYVHHKSSPDPIAILDSIQQVIMCDANVGWRSHQTTKRQIIVIAKHETRRAGHGDIALFLKPNDGECHMRNSTDTDLPKEDYINPLHVYETLSESHTQVYFFCSHSLLHHYKVSAIYTCQNHVFHD
uniref:Integrin beta-1 (Trinotate prediction) n=1 Tax=Myxobolus squamalis TaxID=59785 RepID=A0A6B2FZL8_MYXSQ